MKQIVTSILAVLTCSIVFAQGDVDALRYSSRNLTGTARSAGIGGAIGALGADILNASTNPAGLAQFRSNEWSLGLSYLNNSNRANFIGLEKTDLQSNLNVPSLGIVFTNLNYDPNGRPRKEGWVNINTSFSYNRSNSFHRNISFEGTNNQSSFLDHIAERSRGLGMNDFGDIDEGYLNGFNYLEDMFWWAYLIDTAGNNTYAGVYDPRFNNMYQRGRLTQSGRMAEYAFSMAANYSNKVYLGGSINITQVRFEERMEFTEIDDPRTTWNFNNYTLERVLETRGNGVGITLGAVVLPAPNFRAGISLQTPVNIRLNDTYSDQLRTVMDNTDQYDYKTKEGNFEYRLSTPLRTTFSAAWFAEKKGFLSADLELLAYQNMRLTAADAGFSNYFITQNDNIQRKYDHALNLRVGGELVKDDFRLRGGYGTQGSPFRNNPGYINHNWSLGFGIRERKTGFDIAFVQQRVKDTYFPYQLETGVAPSAKNRLVMNQIVFGISTKF